MVRSLNLICALIVAGSLNAFAVSGIGVAAVNGWIRSIHLEDNAVVDSFPLAKGWNPAINTHGTHVVFWLPGNDADTLAIVRADVPMTSPDYKIKPLVAWQNGASGNIDWPQGDWVWVALNRKNAPARAVLWRFNVKTLESRKVVMWKEGSTVVRITGNGQYAFGHAYGARFFMSLEDILADAKPDTILRNQNDWTRDGTKFGGGCNMAASPDGRHIVSTHSSGHTVLNATSLDHATRKTQGAATVEVGEWNDRALDTTFQYCVSYQRDPCFRVEKTGGGLATISNWTSNSRYWWCPISGWSPGGRFGDNGSNLILLNWHDSTSLNITKIPHKTQDNLNRNAPAATIEKGHGVGDGDFWVSAPRGDIDPAMLDDLDNRDSYAIPCIDDNAPCADPEARDNLRVTATPEIHIQDSVFRNSIHAWLTCDDPGAVIRYTLDGSWPNAQSPAFTDSITVDTTLTLRAVAFKNGQDPSWWPAKQRFRKLTLVNAETVAGDIDGLYYEIYRGICNLPDNFNGLELVDSGTVDSVQELSKGDCTVSRLWGYIDVPQTGYYTFYMHIDDGARLYLGPELIIHQSKRSDDVSEGRIQLEAGKHPLFIEYYQAHGSRYLDMSYEGPGIDSTAVPAAAFSYVPGNAPSQVTAVTKSGPAPISVRTDAGMSRILLRKATTVRIPYADAWQARAVDLAGRTVRSYTGNGPATIAIDRQTLGSGVYLLYVRSRP
ncbi:MAG: hypothetical protein GF398_17445 [Chitinivibrionales bacterium]|nr:hypothetical protein [Chitinivibrionales bacterium]